MSMKAELRLDEMTLRMAVAAGLTAQGYLGIDPKEIRFNHSIPDRNEDASYGAVIKIEVPRIKEG